MIKEQEGCRVCGGVLEVVLDLGSIHPSAFLRPEESVSDEDKAPLVLSRCTTCGLVQLKHTIDLDLMYRQYWYASSLNKSMVSSLKDVVADIESKVELKDGDTVVDIGCNDGTMLNLYSYPERLIQVGYDPALNLSMGDYKFKFINDYFSSDTYVDSVGNPFPKAKVITAIAMFYDLPDPNKFVDDVRSILAEDGIFVVQFTDLLSMIKATAFDNICHEHLEYYRLEDVVSVLEANGLKVIDVSYNDVNGGSLRVTSCLGGSSYPEQPSVMESLRFEKEYLAENSLESFSKNVEVIKFKTRGMLDWAKTHNLKIFSLGASTKGNTFLQICGVTSDYVPFAAEVNKDKFGLRAAGSDIEIIDQADALIKHPDYLLVPIWHFKENIINNPRILDYMKSGGKLIFPLPEFHIVYMSYGEELNEAKI